MYTYTTKDFTLTLILLWCIYILVWTPCLMHRCVYLMIHITKLQLQITFSKPLYTPHSACIHWDLGYWKFDVCTACDSWDNNIQLAMVKDWRRLILISKFWGCPSLGPGVPFLDNDTCARGGYLFVPEFFSCMMPSMDGWWDEWMDGKIDGSHEKASRKTTTKSFIICNFYIYTKPV